MKQKGAIHGLFTYQCDVANDLLFQTGRQLEAEQSYKYALKVGYSFEKYLIILTIFSVFRKVEARENLVNYEPKAWLYYLMV